MSDTEVPERADSVDVAVTAEHRIVLDAVKHRLTELSSRDQEVLLSSFEEEPARSRLESVRLAVARHRARNRLRLLLDGLVGWVALLWARRGRVWSAPAEAIAYAAVPTAACLVISIAAWTPPANQQIEVAHGSIATAEIAPRPVSRSAASAMPHRTDTGRDGRSGGPATSPPSAARPINIVVTKPDGQPANAFVRPKEPSDHLWCFTPPPVTGQGTRCVDSPVKVPTP
jgi:hypothetical protein